MNSQPECTPPPSSTPRNSSFFYHWLLTIIILRDSWPSLSDMAEQGALNWLQRVLSCYNRRNDDHSASFSATCFSYVTWDVLKAESSFESWKVNWKVEGMFSLLLRLKITYGRTILSEYCLQATWFRSCSFFTSSDFLRFSRGGQVRHLNEYFEIANRVLFRA